MVSLGFQHVLTMFPATVLVALLTGFDVGVTLFASGLATVIALVGSGMRIRMYYGSSFSYIAAIRGIATSAVVGILINLIFLIFPPERYVPAARMAEMRASK